MIFDKIKKWCPEALDFTEFSDLKKQMKFLFHLDSFGEYIGGGESSDSK